MTISHQTSSDRRRELYGALAHRAGYRAGRLAKLCGVSLRQLERYFHDDMGCPPGRWLRGERIRTACELLNSATSIKEVAQSLGFGSPSHFSTQFKNSTGRCPSEYTLLRNQASSTDQAGDVPTSQVGSFPSLGETPDRDTIILAE